MSQMFYEGAAVLTAKGYSGDMHPVVLWDDQNVVLIDTGLPMQFEILKSEMAELGLAPAQVTHILFTHHDIDHIGCAKEFLKESPKIETVAHIAEVPYLNGEKTPLKIAALEADLESLSEEKRGFYHMLKQGFANRQIEITAAVQDGDILPVCGGIQVILTDGHTKGHVSYYLIDKKVLVGGDAVNVVDGVLHGPNPVYTFDLVRAKQSLKKLLPLELDQIIAYHGGVVKGELRENLKILLEADNGQA